MSAWTTLMFPPRRRKSLGATIHVGPQEIPNVGWFTVMADPTGRTIAIFQPK